MNPVAVVLGIVILVVGLVAIMMPPEAANAIKIESMKERASQFVGGGLIVVAALLVLGLALMAAKK